MTSFGEFTTVSVSLPNDFYDRVAYVADYFSWPVTKTASYMLMRAVSDVHFGDDLELSKWRDPRKNIKKSK